MAVDTDRFRATLLGERERVLRAIDYLHEETPGSLEDQTEEILGARPWTTLCIDCRRDVERG